MAQRVLPVNLGRVRVAAKPRESPRCKRLRGAAQ
jgi:hypothetical protein